MYQKILNFDFRKLKNKTQQENLKLLVLSLEEEKILDVLVKWADDLYDYEEIEDEDEEKNKEFLLFLRDSRFMPYNKKCLGLVKNANELD